MPLMHLRGPIYISLQNLRQLQPRIFCKTLLHYVQFVICTLLASIRLVSSRHRWKVEVKCIFLSILVGAKILQLQARCAYAMMPEVL